MKKWKAALAIAAAGALLVSCKGATVGSKGFSPEKSCIYVEKNGTVFSAVVEAADGASYTTEGLKAYAAKELSSYNEEQGAEAAFEPVAGTTLPAALKDCSVKDGKAVLVLQFASPEQFVRFADESQDRDNQVNRFDTDTAEAARSKGWIEGPLLTPGKNIALVPADSASINKLAGERTVLVETEHPVTLQTEGKIRFVTEGVTLEQEQTAIVPEGKHLIIFE